MYIILKKHLSTIKLQKLFPLHAFLFGFLASVGRQIVAGIRNISYTNVSTVASLKQYKFKSICQISKILTQILTKKQKNIYYPRVVRFEPYHIQIFFVGGALCSTSKGLSRKFQICLLPFYTFFFLSPFFKQS